MSEFIGDMPENDDESVEEGLLFEPDPSTVAFLDQQSAEFREMADKFEQYHGFRHECRCDKDYAEGKIVEVTECFASMIVQSLDTCARLNAESLALRQMLQQMFTLNELELDGTGIAGADSESVDGTPETTVGGTADADSGVGDSSSEVA